MLLQGNHFLDVTAVTETLDKYYLFIERALSLLKDTGVLGYIVPHKFMNIQSGAELEDFSQLIKMLKKLHFGTHIRSLKTEVLILVFLIDYVKT